VQAVIPPGRERARGQWSPRPPLAARPCSGYEDGALAARRPVSRAARVPESGPGSPSHGPAGPRPGGMGKQAVRPGDGLAGRCGRGTQSPGQATAPAASLSTRGPRAHLRAFSAQFGGSSAFATPWAPDARAVAPAAVEGRAGGGLKWKCAPGRGGAGGRGPTCGDRGPRAQPCRQSTGSAAAKARAATGGPKSRAGTRSRGSEPDQLPKPAHTS
jgi:hypothetical protein